MNIVVRPEGTAELDDREVASVAYDVLAWPGQQYVSWVQVNLTKDTQPVGTVMFHASAASMLAERDRNQLAQKMVADLCGAHMLFVGIVVLADLDRDTAHRLIDAL